MTARSSKQGQKARRVKAAPDRQVSLGDVVGVFRRRGWIFAVAFALITLVGVALAFRLPPVYRSTGILLAEAPAVPEYVVRSTVPDYPEERVRVVTQRVLTGENLRRIAEDHGLYPELDSAEGLVLREFRDHLRLSAENPEMLENILGTGPNASALAFSISFSDRDPAVARDVARDLVDLYLHENQAARREQATATAEFLSVEVERLAGEIAEREQLIAEFKRENAGSLPEIGDANRDLLDRVERDLDDTEREIRSLREREQLYSSELAELSPYAAIVDETGATVLAPADELRVLQRRYIQLSSQYGEDHPDLVRLRREIAALGAVPGVARLDVDALRVELEQREAELAAARMRYSDDHPDIPRLERLVANLRQSIGSASSAAPPGRAPAPDNPVYIQRRVMLEGTRTELRAALDRRESLRLRKSELENQLTVSPDVEREFRELSRGYDQLLAQYNDADLKLREARTAVNLESDASGERFVVLTEPGLPAAPAQPNRIAFVLLTLVVAVGVGAALVAVAERRDDTLRNAHDVQTMLGIPPLAAIPSIRTERDQRSRRLRQIAGVAAAGVWAWTIAVLILSPAT